MYLIKNQKTCVNIKYIFNKKINILYIKRIGRRYIIVKFSLMISTIFVVYFA